MTKSTKKHPAKKRAYVKKSAKWTKKDSKNAIQAIELLHPPKPVIKKDTEIEQLTAICSMMDNFNPEQKQRILKFLCGRYYDFM